MFRGLLRIIANYAHVPNPSGSRQSAPLVALGNAIRQTRKRKGISQEQLALMAEVDRSYMGRVERGDNNVAILTLAKIAKTLGVAVAEIAAKAKL
jgi:transcriptional regulator with XRE-family HTH domain